MKKVKSMKKWSICKLNKREVAEYGFEYAVIHPDNAEYMGMGILTPADTDIECETLEQAIAWVESYDMNEYRELCAAAGLPVEEEEEEEEEETPAEEPAHTLTAMTCSDLDELDRDARIFLRELLTSSVDDLEHAYRITRDATPAETVAVYVASSGYADAVATVASLVNRYAWDGRISRKVAEWAARVPSSVDADAALRLGVFTDRIHRAHLDQIAEALMAFVPETPAEDNVCTIADVIRPEEPETVTESAEETPATQTTTTAATLTASPVRVDDLRAALDLGEYADRLNDYRGSMTYICDAVAEIADAGTSIYYTDIMAFISEHPDALADVVAEGLYDPAHDYDLYRHGQAAEYMLIERDVYDHLADALRLLAYDYIQYDLGADVIPGHLADEIDAWADEIDTGNLVSEITDRARDAVAEWQGWTPAEED